MSDTTKSIFSRLKEVKVQRPTNESIEEPHRVSYVVTEDEDEDDEAVELPDCLDQAIDDNIVGALVTMPDGESHPMWFVLFQDPEADEDSDKAEVLCVIDMEDGTNFAYWDEIDEFELDIPDEEGQEFEIDQDSLDTLFHKTDDEDLGDLVQEKINKYNMLTEDDEE